MPFGPSSFKTVVLLIPVANPERKSKEGNSKVGVVESIYEGIQRRVRPPEPQQKVLQNLILPDAVLVEKGSGDVVSEEWKPAGYETILPGRDKEAHSEMASS